MLFPSFILLMMILQIAKSALEHFYDLSTTIHPGFEKLLSSFVIVEKNKYPIYDEIVVLPYHDLHIEMSTERQSGSVPSELVTSSSTKSNMESSNIITLPESSRLLASIAEVCDDGNLDNSNIVSLPDNCNDIEASVSVLFNVHDSGELRTLSKLDKDSPPAIIVIPKPGPEESYFGYYVKHESKFKKLADMCWIGENCPVSICMKLHDTLRSSKQV